MDIKDFYFQNIQEEEYHYRFLDSIKNVNKIYNIFDGYKEVNDYRFEVYDAEDAITKFRGLCQPDVDFTSSENKCWFNLITYYLYKIGYEIKEFPRVLARPPVDPSEFTYREIRNRIIAQGDDDNGIVRYARRRILVASLTFEHTSEMLGELPFYTSNNERLDANISTANKVLGDLIKVSERVCLNYAYNGETHENVINDYFRDMLSNMDYSEVKDQTRHGISAGGKDAGEVDILLTKDNKEIAIFEGLKLKGIVSDYIDKHIEKSITNYNALGTATFIVAYVNVADFEGFWSKYVEHIENYPFTLGVKKKLEILAHPNASTRVATMILTRDDFDFPVYFLALKIC